MTRKMLINSCGGCPHHDHSGSFTQGGAIPLCRAIAGKGKKTEKWPDQYSSVLPFEAVLDSRTNQPTRAATYVIPDWCLLPKD